MKGYIYNAETMVLVAVLIGTQEQIEDYPIDNDVNGLTYTPAFGSVDGVIDNGDYETVKI